MFVVSGHKWDFCIINYYYTDACLAWVVILEPLETKLWKEIVTGNLWKFKVRLIFVQATLPCCIGLVFCQNIGQILVLYEPNIIGIRIPQIYWKNSKIFFLCICLLASQQRVKPNVAYRWKSKHFGQRHTAPLSNFDSVKDCKEQFYACQEPSALTGLPPHQSRW